MALQELSLKEQESREQRYNDVHSIKLDMLRRLQLRLLTGRNVGDFFEKETKNPDTARVIGEKNIQAFYDYLVDFRSNETSASGTMGEWLDTLDIFTPLEVEILKESSLWDIKKGISLIVEYMEWSSQNNKELYPLRHFTYLLSIAMESKIYFLTFLEKINEDRFLNKIAKHFYEDEQHGTIKDAIKSFDAPDWYTEALSDGFDGGMIGQVSKEMVSYMEKTNQ